MDVFKEALRKAIFEAMISDAPIFSGKLSELESVGYPRDLENLKLVRLKCRATVEWLFRNPLWTHLVTNTLRRYLKGEARDQFQAPPPRPKETPVSAHAKRGPKPTERERVKTAMLKDLKSGQTCVDRLESDTQVNLALFYKASRQTCLAARKEALSQFAANSSKGNSGH
jgi:hypothetical protein